MLLDDVVGHPEPEARALAGGLRGEEGVEDARQHVGRDAGAGVEHLDEHAVTLGASAHGQHALAGVVRHRLLGVLHEIEQHLPDLIAVGPHGRHGVELGDRADAGVVALRLREVQERARLLVERAGPAHDGAGP